MNNKRLKVLFLTRYPLEGASSRYRVHQYIPYLEKLGVSCQVESFMDSSMYKLVLQPGNTLKKILFSFVAITRRLSVLLKYKNYDIVYMQRELLPVGPPIFERWMSKRGAVLFYDYDDALFIKKASRYNPIATLLRSPDKTLNIFKLVNCVVAGNDWLRDVAIDHGANAVTVEVAEDTNRIKMHAPHNNNKTVTIGWLGSKTTVKYLKLIEKVLQQVVLERPNVRFEIMGDSSFSMEGVPWECTDWSLKGELDALQRFDIGLMPLPMETWAKGKSGGKARTYMAAGIVPVCTKIGYNMELIAQGRTGYLCTSEDEWLSSLLSLVDDAELRQSVALDARTDIEERFSLQKQAQLLRNTFDDVLDAEKSDEVMKNG